MNTIEPFFEDTSYVFYCSCILAFVAVCDFFFVNYFVMMRFMGFPQLPDEKLCIRAQKSEKCIAVIANQGYFCWMSRFFLFSDVLLSTDNSLLIFPNCFNPPFLSRLAQSLHGSVWMQQASHAVFFYCLFSKILLLLKLSLTSFAQAERSLPNKPLSNLTLWLIRLKTNSCRHDFLFLHLAPRKSTFNWLEMRSWLSSTSSKIWPSFWLPTIIYSQLV